MLRLRWPISLSLATRVAAVVAVFGPQAVEDAFGRVTLLAVRVLIFVEEGAGSRMR